MIVVRCFAQAREAAGTGRAELPGETVAEVLAAAVEAFGPEFAAVLENSRVWLDGEPATPDQLVGSAEELAVLPPVSGG